MLCPKCHVEMETVSFQQVLIDRCPACQGLWFDAGEAESLSQTLVSEWLDRGDPELGRQLDRADKVRCPRCDLVMENHFELESSQVGYEVCPAHGRFYDAGEFILWVRGQLP